MLIAVSPFVLRGQARSLENAAATAAAAVAAAATATATAGAAAADSSAPPERNAGSGAAPARLASAHHHPTASGAPVAGGGHKRPSQHLPTWAREGSLLPHELVRETLVDGVVSGRETFRQPEGPAEVKKGWGARRAAGGGSDGESHVCTLVPGATAMFEVAATAPEEVADGPVKMEVRF